MISSLARIISITYSASRTVTFFSVQLDESQQRTMLAWQFVMIERIDWAVDLNGRVFKRAYSIASTNQQLEQDGTLSFYIKQASDYWLSHYLTYDIQIWDMIKLTGPLGHFTDPHLCQRYLLLSTGSGLTPILSHYQTLISRDDVRIAHLYGERVSDFLIDDIIDQRHNTDRIRHYLTLSQWRKQGWHSGYVQQGIEGALHWLGGTDIVAMLCGKPSMVDEVRELLLSHWVVSERILFEKY